MKYKTEMFQAEIKYNKTIHYRNSSDSIRRENNEADIAYDVFERYNPKDWRILGSISSTFYIQLLRLQIPKA